MAYRLTIPRIRMRFILRLIAFVALLAPSLAHAEDGYELWLRYHPVEARAQAQYRPFATALVPRGAGAALTAARNELLRGLGGLLARPVPVSDAVKANG